MAHLQQFSMRLLGAVACFFWGTVGLTSSAVSQLCLP